MPPLQAQLLVDCKNLLGECVLWNSADQRVYWTDVYSCRLFSCSSDGGDLLSRPLPDKLGSFAFDPDGNLLGAFAKGLFRMQLPSGRIEPLTVFEPELEHTRLNDGRCDRSGRFVVGGCHQGYYNPVSSVIRYRGGNGAQRLLSGVALSNGIAFSLDGRRMYFSDSETQIYHWYEYDAESDRLGARHVLTEIPKGQGFADGSAVDADDNLWNARYYGGLVQQYHPDGSEGLRVQVPTDCVTCVCFGGDQLDTMFITSGCKDLKPDQKASQPHAGGLFCVRPGVLSGVRGVPEVRFAERLF